MKHILILSYVPFYNRQGFDLHECLLKAGCKSRLLQLDAKTDKAKGVFGVKQTKPHGRWPSVHMLLNMARFLLRAIFVRRDVIVAIGRPSLLLVKVLSLFSRCKVIYYSLEYSVFSGRDKAIIRKCVDKIIDVEENRLERLLKDNALSVSSMVVYNMPHLHALPKGGKLHKYLKETRGIPVTAKVAVYAGSYQSYACVNQIIEAARKLPAGAYVVFMTYNLPKNVKDLAPGNVIVVPPVSGDEFYEWLADADCALLPYESESDFNVQYCSPQKIFDCYLVGVPFVASVRPIVMNTIAASPSVAESCDFNNPEMISNAIVKIFQACRADVREAMRKLHVSRFNYDLLSDRIVRFVTN